MRLIVVGATINEAGGVNVCGESALTVWLTPHIKTESRGSFALNNLTFWCLTRNLFFLSLERPLPPEGSDMFYRWARSSRGTWGAGAVPFAVSATASVHHVDGITPTGWPAVARLPLNERRLYRNSINRGKTADSKRRNTPSQVVALRRNRTFP